MIPIIERMTPEEFISALNTDFAGVMSSYTTIVDTMHTDDLEIALNDNFVKADTLVGIRGSSFAQKINSNFNESIALRPTDLTVTWIDDFARITFTDNSGGTSQHGIYETKNGGAYTLVHTLAAGITIYDYHTWQNATLGFKIKSIQSNLYSAFPLVVNIITPLVFKTDQSTLTPVVFTYLNFATNSGHTMNIDWGDGTNEDRTAYGYMAGTTKNYSVEKNPYFIKISGDINFIDKIEFTAQAKAYGDLSKWKLPDALMLFHFYVNNFTGNISSWGPVLPSGLEVFHIGLNNFTGDISSWVWPDVLRDMHLGQNLDGDGLSGDLSDMLWPIPLFHFLLGKNNFTGDISGWVLPTGCARMELSRCGFTGDLSDWEIPDNMCDVELNYEDLEDHRNHFTGNISGWILPTILLTYGDYIFKCNNLPFTGDCSSWIIPSTINEIMSFKFQNCDLTGLPRGNFKWVVEYWFYGNNCSSGEIDSLLAYIDGYFTGEVVPLTNCSYVLNGTGMGIPSPAGLTSRTSILGKYTAVGKTATITVNS